MDGDPRFVVSRSPRRLGFYRNFERALSLAPRRARRYVALADQDDAWHPDKLETLLGASSATRSSSTATRGSSTRDGRARRRHLLGAAPQQPHRPALAAGRQHGHRRRVAASARELLDDALPFPPAQFAPLPRPLARASSRWRSARSRSSTGRSTTTSSTAARRSATPPPTACRRCASAWPRLRRDPRERVRLWRSTTSSTSAGCCSSPPCWSMRCGGAHGAGQAPRARRASCDAERSLAGARPALGGAARASCSAATETLGAEWMLAYALRLAAGCSTATRARAAAARPAPRRRAAAEPRAAARRRAGRRGPGARDRRRRSRRSSSPSRDDAPARVNLLDPDDRPQALLRRLHREVQPRPAARRARARACAS